MKILSKATILWLSFLKIKMTKAFGVPPPTTRHRTFGNTAIAAKPKRGTVVDSYQTVSVNCANCGFRLFRYKKKNGTKSNLIKCYVERITEDCGGILPQDGSVMGDAADTTTTTYACPRCDTNFARPTLIRGLPALKLVGGKTRMTKK